jgi:hypothetical protein
MIMNQTHPSHGLTPDTPLICPHLKRGDDATVRYGYAHALNFCYKADKHQPVSLSHQGQVCFSPDYGACPVYETEWKGPFPPGMRAPDLIRRKHLRNRLFLPLGLALLLYVLVFAILWSYNQWAPVGLLWGSSAQPQATPTLIPPATVTPTASPLPPTRTHVSRTPTLTSTATGTLASPSPSLSVRPGTNTSLPVPVTGGAFTPTPAGSPTLTIGPRLETPFGPDHRYLVHLVSPGENIEYLARTYKTSSEVLKKINFVKEQHILWEDVVIVIQPGQTDPANVFPMQAVYIEQNIRLADFIKTYPVAEDFLRQNNEITGDLLKAKRWVIIPR